MEKINTLRSSDVGRVAVSKDGFYRVKVLRVNTLNEATVEHLKDTGSRTVGNVSTGFVLVDGNFKMYWEDTESIVSTSSGQMSNIQYLLTKLSEECNEVGQMAAKCQQFGLDEVYDGDGNILTNRQRLHAEINDLLGVIDMLNEEEDFDFVPDPIAHLHKRAKISKYRRYSVNLGFVSEKGE